MQKTYSISANFGEITKDLDDRIQKDSFKRLRDNSLEEMTNVMPDKYFLAKSVNGVELEYFILGKPSKAFTLNANGVETVFHIYEDRIITAILSLDKIFIDTIPEDILVDVNSVDTALIVKDPQGEFLQFNSITGVYKCAITKRYPATLDNGSAYFTKIEIPSDLKAETINSQINDIYFFWKKKDLTDQATPIWGSVLDEELTGAYIELKQGFKVGDVVEFSLNHTPFLTGLYTFYPTIITYKATIIQDNIRGFYFERNGTKRIYPDLNKPPKITKKSLKKNIYSHLYEDGFVDIPDTTYPINLMKLDIKFTMTDIKPYPLVWQMDVVNGVTTRADPLNKNEEYELLRIDERSPHTNIDLSCLRYGYETTKVGTFGARNTLICDVWCDTFKTVRIQIFQSKDFNATAPTVVFLDGRLVVSSGNVVKFSKVNEPDNFNFEPDNVPTESDAFFRTITDVNEIFWLYKWGDIYKGQGIAIGTPQKIVYFSSVATLFNTSQIGGLDVPCSRIKPIQITVQGNPANLVVLNGRKKISATIFTRDQSQQIPLTDAIDFFETDPIKKIQNIKYGEDQLLFALTDAGKIYGCLTGGDRLAWFRIQLQYPVRDIATSDYNGVKKLFIVSLIGIGSNYDAVGSINFTEGIKQVSAEYYTNLYMPRSYDFSTEIPKITGVLDYKQKKELTEEEKHKIVKPMQASLTFHNMEVINNTVNTLSTNTNREISNVVLNVKDTNLIRVNYKIKFNGREEIKKEAFTLKALDDNFNTNTLRETIKIYKNSMSAHSVKLNIETLENSTIPTIIKSISFDTKYAIK